MDTQRCTWCGREVSAGEGYRLTDGAGEREAVFCRLEHVIPWAIRGAAWDTGRSAPAKGESAPSCSHCGAELGEAHPRLVRHREEHRIADGFCSVDHLLAWAKAGGRWR